MISSYINEKIQETDNLLELSNSSTTELLIVKSTLTKSKQRLLTFLRNIKFFKPHNNIKEFRKLVHRVYINDRINNDIKLNLNNLENYNLHISSHEIELKIWNKNRCLIYNIFF